MKQNIICILSTESLTHFYMFNIIQEKLVFSSEKEKDNLHSRHLDTARKKTQVHLITVTIALFYYVWQWRSMHSNMTSFKWNVSNRPCVKKFSSATSQNQKVQLYITGLESVHSLSDFVFSQYYFYKASICLNLICQCGLLWTQWGDDVFCILYVLLITTKGRPKNINTKWQTKKIKESASCCLRLLFGTTGFELNC